MAVFRSRYGACLVSKHLYDGTGLLTWCVHEESKNKNDNGWVFLADNDTEEYLNDVNNWCILPYEKVIEIEPAILSIYYMPVGTELTLVRKEKGMYFVDTNTGEPIEDGELLEIWPWWLQESDQND